MSETATVEVILKKLHDAQVKVMSEAKRFNVLKMGRQWGKTTLTPELSMTPMLDGFPVGYWCPTYKDLYEVWQEMKQVCYPVIKSKDEQVKQITLHTGGKIDFWSMEDPDSGRGRKYKRVIVDEAEKASHFRQAWEQTIRPTLAFYEGDAWILSTPKMGDTYFKELCRYPEKYDDWMSWTMPTHTNPYIKPEELDAMREQLDDLVYRCEVMAEDVDMVDKPFYYGFTERNIQKVSLDPNLPLYISFDFNVNPLCAVVCQHNVEKLYRTTSRINIIDEIVIQNSDIYEACEVIKTRYAGRMIFITGDPSGRARSALTKGNENYFAVIRKALGLGPYQVKILASAPSHNNSSVLVNSLMSRHPAFHIDPKCKHLIADLRYIGRTKDGKIDKSDGDKTHISDALRYYMHVWHWG